MQAGGLAPDGAKDSRHQLLVSPLLFPCSCFPAPRRPLRKSCSALMGQMPTMPPPRGIKPSAIQPPGGTLTRCGFLCPDTGGCLGPCAPVLACSSGEAVAGAWHDTSPPPSPASHPPMKSIRLNCSSFLSCPQIQGMGKQWGYLSSGPSCITSFLEQALVVLSCGDRSTVHRHFQVSIKEFFLSSGSTSSHADKISISPMPYS